MLRIFIRAFILLLTAPAGAQTVHYVTDELSITVRAGQGTNSQIVRTIDTGTEVKVLAVEENGYARVQLDDGAEGWVLSRYLIDEPAAKARLAAVEQERQRLAGENARLQQENQALKAKSTTLEQQLAGIGEESEQLRRESSEIRALAAEPLALKERNDALQGTIGELQDERRVIREKIAALKDARTWFLYGAGTLTAGIILGLLVSRMRRQRRSSWGSF